MNFKKLKFNTVTTLIFFTVIFSGIFLNASPVSAGAPAVISLATGGLVNVVPWEFTKCDILDDGLNLIDCDGNIVGGSPNVPPPPAACTSSPNACGATNTGTMVSGVCNASIPANPSGYGSSCTPAANSCGQTNSGTIKCDGSCSASSPSNSSCPIDGFCSVNHYNCSSGTSVSNYDNAETWTWNCEGINGGGTNTCSENKPPIVLLSGDSGSVTTIDFGQSATITWSSTHATSCTSAGGFSTGGATSGSVSVSPTTNSTYQITCYGPGGTSAPVTTTIQVLNPTVSINASPLRVQVGTGTSVSWSSQDVKSCAVTRKGVAWQTGFASTGTSDIVTNQTTYAISCVTNGAPVTQSVIVNTVPLFNEF